VGDEIVRRLVEPGNNGCALLEVARTRQGEMAELLPLRCQAPIENDVVIVKRVGILLESGAGKAYTSDQNLVGELLAVRNYTRGAGEENGPEVVIESADLNKLPDDAKIILPGIRRGLDIDLGWMRSRAWREEYLLLVDSYTAECLEISDSAPTACHVNLEKIDGRTVRTVLPTVGAVPAYIDAEVRMLPLRT